MKNVEFFTNDLNNLYFCFLSIIFALISVLNFLLFYSISSSFSYWLQLYTFAANAANCCLLLTTVYVRKNVGADPCVRPLIGNDSFPIYAPV